jgi:hypothetical protein
MSIQGNRVSLTAGCLNRVEHLKQSLETWLRAPEIDEVVVADWNNEVPLSESLSEFNDPRLLIARVIDQPHWMNSKCHNLELRLASGDLLLRCDSDYLLLDGFFAGHPLSPGAFYAGNGMVVRKDANQYGLTGALYAFRDDVLAVNGYNERLVYYGHEDEDLFARMTASGLARLDLKLEFLAHLPHPDKTRYDQLQIFSHMPKIESQAGHAEDMLKKLYLIDRSRIIAKNKQWSLHDRMTPWKQTELSGSSAPRLLGCVEVVETIQKETGSPDVGFNNEELLPLAIVPERDDVFRGQMELDTGNGRPSFFPVWYDKVISQEE